MEIIITYLSLPNVLSCRCSWASQLNVSLWLAVHLRSNQCIHLTCLCTFLAYEREVKSPFCSASLSINCLHFALTKTILWQLGKMMITQCLFTPYPAPPNSAAHVNLKEETITRVGRKQTSCHKKLNLRSLTSYRELGSTNQSTCSPTPLNLAWFWGPWFYIMWSVQPGPAIL